MMAQLLGSSRRSATVTLVVISPVLEMKQPCIRLYHLNCVPLNSDVEALTRVCMWLIELLESSEG